ncbi:9 kDa protein [Persimmon virus B]|uniref:9 kDa protein n=1 Tax=Persimmon virus B TaxID=1493829 RepID=A0A0A8JEM3_9CLOS|nr:9 kDa protein [Persimmon virus B]BAQ08215.1 9 kDa protein [Persimmon virus B]
MNSDDEVRTSVCQSLIWINTVYFVVWVVLTIYLHNDGIKVYAAKLSIASIPFLFFNMISLCLVSWLYKRDEGRVNNVV